MAFKLGHWSMPRVNRRIVLIQDHIASFEQPDLGSTLSTKDVRGDANSERFKEHNA